MPGDDVTPEGERLEIFRPQGPIPQDHSLVILREHTRTRSCEINRHRRLPSAPYVICSFHAPRAMKFALISQALVTELLIEMENHAVPYAYCVVALREKYR